MPPHNETAAKRALRNKDAQRTQDESLAVFLTNRNRAIPSGLKRSGDGTDGRQERNVRRRDSNIAQKSLDHCQVEHLDTIQISSLSILLVGPHIHIHIQGASRKIHTQMNLIGWNQYRYEILLFK